jgi:hypothetical protein
MNKLISISIILALFSCCSYEMVKGTSSNGEVRKFKQYKDAEKDRIYSLKNYFNVLTYLNKTNKYQQEIIVDTLNSKFVFQFDSMFVHLENPDSNFAELFYNGLYDPHSIYKKLIESSFKLLDWEKNSITISAVNRLKEVEVDRKKMRFEIVVYLGLCPCHGPFEQTFYLEITNKNLSRKVDFKEFVKGAEISAFIE